MTKSLIFVAIIGIILAYGLALLIKSGYDAWGE